MIILIGLMCRQSSLNAQGLQKSQKVSASKSAYLYHLTTPTNVHVNFQISGYSGDAGDSWSSGGHVGQRFTTRDNDNDNDSNNCAQRFTG